MKRSERFWNVLAVLFCVLPLMASAQTGPQPVARLSTGLAKFGSAVTMVVEIEGARSARIVEVPDVEGLEVSGPGRPSRQEFRSIINGRVSSRSTLRWTLELRPMEIGDFVIPPIVLDVDGRRAQTRELSLKVVKDMRGEDLGFFEIVDAPTKVFEGQPFTLDLRLGWDAQLAVERADLRLPWWQSMPGTLEAEGAPRNVRANWLRFALNGRSEVLVEELDAVRRGDRLYRSFRLKQSLIPTRSGTLDFPTSSLEFATVKRRGIVSQSYESYYATLPAFELEVSTIPEEGRPFDWTGAVGLIETSRRVDRRDVDVGESIKLAVSWIGSGNLEFFDAPDPARLDSFAGFRVLGTEDEFRGDERRVTYDLVPVSPEVDEIPAVPLWIFDPVEERYRQIETEPVPIRVRPLAEGLGLEDEEVTDGGMILDIRDLHLARSEGGEWKRPGASWVAGTFFAIPILWLAGRAWVRRRGDPDSVEARKRRAAAGRLRRELRQCKEAREQGEALQRFLAARSGEAEQAWLGRDPERWLSGAEGRDLDPALAAELAQILGELDERTWAGDGRPMEASVLSSLATRLMKGGL